MRRTVARADRFFPAIGKARWESKTRLFVCSARRVRSIWMLLRLCDRYLLETFSLWVPSPRRAFACKAMVRGPSECRILPGGATSNALDVISRLLSIHSHAAPVAFLVPFVLNAIPIVLRGMRIRLGADSWRDSDRSLCRRQPQSGRRARIHMHSRPV